MNRQTKYEISEIKTSLRTVSIVLIKLEDRLQEIIDRLDKVESMNPVMRFVLFEDKRGFNHSKEQLKSNMTITDFDEQFEKLLMSGEIFEIETKIYPTDSKNLNTEEKNV